ncbi:G-type lectin S-receptor-like serine/threonine-protein kinase At4g27290 [Populus alba]|uniref:G-type lectin S-receptor-like serine/threonine-protein kinase At4g27290 n=1 Tax=Populus alba TaxID=43335 RepID=UPI003CC714D8
MCVKTKPCFWLFVLLLLFVYDRTCFSIGDDTLLVGQSLSASQKLISQNGTFELGFFKPGTSVNIYLGIWYKNFEDKATVWVANRESSSNDPASSKLELSADGNLVLLTNFTKTIWSTALASSMSNTSTAEAVLLDDGNFVVRDGSNPPTIYWQSFDYPTDTWLPGGKLGINKHTGQVQRLISWKNSDDPAPGMFSIGMDPNGSSQLFIEWNRSHRYWSSGDWNGEIFALVPEMRLNNILKFSHVSNENESYFTYSLYNTSTLSRTVIDVSGQIKQLTSLEGVWNWTMFWSQPRDQAEVYGLCGVFGVFQGNSSSSCECLKGFKPLVQNDWSSGCVRKSPLQCQNKRSAGKEDGFLKISNLTLPANSKTYQKVSAERCRLDCLEICSCVAYAYNKNSGCSLWEGDLINLQQHPGVADGRAGAEIYIRLAASEPELQIGNGSTRTGNIKRTIRTTLAVAIPTTLITFGLFMYFRCLRKGKLMHRGKEYTGHDLLLFDFDTDPSSTNKESSSVDNRKNRWSKNMELPLFSYESVSVATGQFSDKLGEGGFGPVYKGKLSKGLEIAVKRLSERSGQGLEEFRNETILIAKLQHRNLVRLLGSCIERDEKMLIYEYMPNKSLDFFLFDANRGQILDWGTRIRIIEGIAQGLLYLHRYSRLRIIHRDLKPSNILLDSEMNPKISDFGMARIFGGNETQANTNRIVGTYGYMSPEYAIQGLFSIKSDVFSFGVLVLEIVSGRKNTSFYHSDSLNLLGHAWKLWNSNKASDLMDPSLGDPPSTATLLRYINIGLLCVQESPDDRPTMSDVISMIVNEHVALPEPKQPAFVAGRNMAEQRPLMRSSGVPSVNNMTITAIDGR